MFFSERKKNWAFLNWLWLGHFENCIFLRVSAGGKITFHLPLLEIITFNFIVAVHSNFIFNLISTVSASQMLFPLNLMAKVVPVQILQHLEKVGRSSTLANSSSVSLLLCLNQNLWLFLPSHFKNPAEKRFLKSSFVSEFGSSWHRKQQSSRITAFTCSSCYLILLWVENVTFSSALLGCDRKQWALKVSLQRTWKNAG